MANQEPPVEEVPVPQLDIPQVADPRPPTPPPNDPPMFDELDLPLAVAPSVRVNNPLVVISKKSRPTDLDKRTALFNQITKNQHDRYKLMNTSLKSIDDLQETYGLQVLLKTTATIFIKYDLTDVFTIVFPTNTNGETIGRDLEQRQGKTRTVNLLEDYLAVTVDEVAKSTRWYVTWTDHQRAPYITENLSLSYEFFRNHVEDTLWGKLLEDMEPFVGTSAQGGPLLFVLMMRRLQANSQLVITTIQTKIKTLRVDQYTGENVSDMVSHLRALIGRLRTLERRDETGRVITPVLPSDINKTLLKLFQTSSDAKFNGIFQNKELTSYEKALTEGDSAYGNPEGILMLANAIYSEMVAGETGWTGADHKASAGAFVAGGGNTGECFNCGGNHPVSACPKPKDESKIALNKKKFWNAKKAQRGEKKGNGNGDKKRKWPAAPKDRMKNRALIDGKYYYYHFQDKKWKVCDNQSEGANKQQLANLATDKSPPADEKKKEAKGQDATSKAQQAASNFIAAIQKNVNNLAKDLD